MLTHAPMVSLQAKDFVFLRMTSREIFTSQTLTLQAPSTMKTLRALCCGAHLLLWAWVFSGLQSVFASLSLLPFSLTFLELSPSLPWAYSSLCFGISKSLITKILVKQSCIENHFCSFMLHCCNYLDRYALFLGQREKIPRNSP